MVHFFKSILLSSLCMQ